jgi:hypothetical protein
MHQMGNSPAQQQANERYSGQNGRTEAFYNKKASKIKSIWLLILPARLKFPFRR